MPAHSSSSPQCSPRKRKVVDPGRVQVEIVCGRYAVGVKCVFGANKLRDDLLIVRVPGWSNGLNWNVAAKMYMNADRHDRQKPTCPSLGFLKLLCHACEQSEWCSHWYLMSRTGQSIPCGAHSIDNLQVDFDETPGLEKEEAEFTCDDLCDGPLPSTSVGESAAPCGQRQIAPAFRHYKQFTMTTPALLDTLFQ